MDKKHKIRITMVETRILEKEFLVDEEEYQILQGDGPDNLESEALNEMYDCIPFSKYASTDYDYSVLDMDTDKYIVEMYDA